jgi:hypothetical protein
MSRNTVSKLDVYLDSTRAPAELGLVGDAGA